MTNYKKKYDKLKVEYDILRRGKGGKKSLKPDELFTTLQSLYIDKLERMNDQQIYYLSKHLFLMIKIDKLIEMNLYLNLTNLKLIHIKEKQFTTKKMIPILNYT